MKKKYNYFLLDEKWLARLEEDRLILDSKEFFAEGEWQKNEELNRCLNDCIMDYDPESVFDYKSLSEEEAVRFMKIQAEVHLK